MGAYFSFKSVILLHFSPSPGFEELAFNSIYPCADKSSQTSAID